MDWTLEVVLVPVSDVDRAIAFYRDAVGFDLDHETTMGEMRMAQLTPPGSGCSIVIGTLPAHREMAPGSLRGLQLVVSDAARARDELLSRGVAAGPITVLDERDGARSSPSATPTATPGRCSNSRFERRGRSSLGARLARQGRLLSEA